MQYLAHHGIKGQKWGVRKYQNADGSLTPEGRKRYGVIGSTKAYIQQRRKNVSKFYKESKNLGDDKLPSQMSKKERKIYDKAEADYKRRQKQAGSAYRQDISRGVQDKAQRAKRFAKAYADTKKVTVKEFMQPSNKFDAMISGASAKLTGRSAFSGRFDYAYRQGMSYARKKYGEQTASNIALTDTSFKSAVAIGSAAFSAYNYINKNNPKYEVPKGYR